MKNYEFSIVELVGPGWSQGATLANGDGTARDVANVIAEELDDLIARCSTEANGEKVKPALEINVTLVED